jgi:hypothetical protein
MSSFLIKAYSFDGRNQHVFLTAYRAVYVFYFALFAMTDESHFDIEGESQFKVNHSPEFHCIKKAYPKICPLKYTKSF